MAAVLFHRFRELSALTLSLINDILLIAKCFFFLLTSCSRKQSKNRRFHGATGTIFCHRMLYPSRFRKPLKLRNFTAPALPGPSQGIAQEVMLRRVRERWSFYLRQAQNLEVTGEGVLCITDGVVLRAYEGRWMTGLRISRSNSSDHFMSFKLDSRGICLSSWR